MESRQEELKRARDRLLQVLEGAEETLRSYAAVDTCALYDEIAAAELAWRNLLGPGASAGLPLKP